MTRHRLCVPIVTPLREGRVHLGDLERLLAFQVERGADVIFASGTTGEHPRLDAEGRASLRDGAIAALRGSGVPCWVGVTGADAEETVALASAAARAGADALVIAPCALPGPVDLVSLLDRVDHPAVYLYDNPDLAGGRSLTHADVSPVLSRVAGIKVSAPVEQVRPWLGVLPVWVGHPDVWFQLAGLSASLDGVVMGMANPLPDLWARAVRAPSTEDRERAAAYTALTTVGGRRRTVAAAKAALVERGVLGRAEVLPGTPALGEAAEAAFRAAFRDFLSAVGTSG